MSQCKCFFFSSSKTTKIKTSAVVCFSVLFQNFIETEIKILNPSMSKPKKVHMLIIKKVTKSLHSIVFFSGLEH